MARNIGDHSDKLEGANNGICFGRQTRYDYRRSFSRNFLSIS